MKKAIESDAVSEMELLQAKSSMDSAEASIRNYEAALRTARTNLGYCTVTAPVSGLITAPVVTAGNYVAGEAQPVKLASIYDDRQMKAVFDIEDVMHLSVANAQGEMVPFSSFTTIEPMMGVSSVNRYNMYTTAGVTATPAKGVSSSEGIREMEQMVHDKLGKNYSYAWTGEAYQETQSGLTVNVVFIFAIIMTILVLAAQYESWSDPIAVVLAMPVAVLGTVFGCMCMNQSISIYTQIGLILLLGMAAKNAILIVEFAMDYRKKGVPIIQAAQEAGQIRFRPIMMTALAFVFGVMPMLFATGPGAGSRKALGAAVVFGMAMNAFIGTLFVPNFWAFMQTLSEKLRRKPTPTPPTVPNTPNTPTSPTTGASG